MLIIIITIVTRSVAADLPGHSTLQVTPWMPESRCTSFRENASLRPGPAALRTERNEGKSRQVTRVSIGVTWVDHCLAKSPCQHEHMIWKERTSTQHTGLERKKNDTVQKVIPARFLNISCTLSTACFPAREVTGTSTCTTTDIRSSERVNGWLLLSCG